MKTTFQICNLSCPNCAAKIEKNLKTEMELSDVSINLTAGSITITHNSPLADNFLDQASHRANQIEDGVYLTALSNTPKEALPDSPISKSDAILLGISIAFLITGILFSRSSLSLWLLLAGYLCAGKNVFLKTFHNIKKGKLLDENVLMLLASSGAFLIGAYIEGTVTMILYVIGEYIQDYSVYRSQESISNLLKLKPQKAVVVTNHGNHVLSPEEVTVGDTLLVVAGEKIALDGVITQGSASIDNSALTGESIPIRVNAGQEVLSGGLVKEGLLKIQVTKPYTDSTIAKILDMITNASAKKSHSEKLLTRFASYYTPAVVISAILLTVIPVVLFQKDFSTWIYRSLVFLAASCPCSLILSIPLTYFAGLNKASKHGILIKGANYLEACASIKQMVFDKTGTLTKGNFTVTEVFAAPHSDKNEVLRTAAWLEYYSKHPIAQSIQSYYASPIEAPDIANYKEISGMGIQLMHQGKRYLCGNLSLMQSKGVIVPHIDSPYTTIYIAKDAIYLGHILIADEIKPDTAKALADLRQMGVKEMVMLTGDKKGIAEHIGKQLGISRIYADLLPEEKYQNLKSLLRSEYKTAFVGDGINDASVIKLADVGIAMGGLGSDIAVESADIILTNDNLSALTETMKIAKKTATILKQNLVLTIGFKLIVLLLGAIGYAGIWLAIFADVGILLIASLNALRAGK